MCERLTKGFLFVQGHDSSSKLGLCPLVVDASGVHVGILIVKLALEHADFGRHVNDVMRLGGCGPIDNHFRSHYRRRLVFVGSLIWFVSFLFVLFGLGGGGGDGQMTSLFGSLGFFRCGFVLTRCLDHFPS